MRNFRIAIQGAAASFHDIAARKYYGEEVEVIECVTFKETCEKLASNEVDYIIMAIENTVAGSILSNYTLIKEYKFRIIGEQFLKIDLHLLGLPGVELKDIEFIQSHPMAIAQCQEFLEQNPEIKVVEHNDTASCAKQIKELEVKNTVAIANLSAAEKYGLSVIKASIGNNKSIYTRFIILSKGDSRPENPDKASICFELKHEKGELADILTIIKAGNINLSKIQSIPIPEKPLKYEFHADLEWNAYSDFKLTLLNLYGNIDQLHILGEYVKGGLDN
jgi:prephenate dehydratase